MSLTGSVSTMPLADLLEWIRATDRAGVLSVRGDGAETMLKLHDGRIIECAALDPPVLLGQFLLFHGLINENDLDTAMREHMAQGKRLGDVLVEKGAVSVEDMQVALRAKAEETVLCAFDHPTGEFTFDPDAAPLEAPLSIDLPIGDVIDMTRKRFQSNSVASAALIMPGHVLRKTSKNPSEKLNWVAPLRNAYNLVDGNRDVDEIVLRVHGTKFDVLQRLHQLHAGGYIELVERPENDLWVGLDIGEESIEVPQELLLFAEIDLSSDPEAMIPVALHQELMRHSGNLSMHEKYILSLCDGTSDLRKIKNVAPMDPRIVVETIQSLIERGWLKTTPMSARPAETKDGRA